MKHKVTKLYIVINGIQRFRLLLLELVSHKLLAEQLIRYIWYQHLAPCILENLFQQQQQINHH